MVVDYAVFSSPGRRLDHIVQVEGRPEILAPVRPSRVDRLPLPGHRPGVEPIARPAMALEPRGGETLRVGQVVREPPHQLQGVEESLPSGARSSENDGHYAGMCPAPTRPARSVAFMPYFWNHLGDGE